MKKRISAYIAYIDELLKSEEERDWDLEIEKHLNHIGFYMHERLVHLIVFCLVAVCTVMSILALVMFEKIVILPLIVMLFVLLVPLQIKFRPYERLIGPIFVLRNPASDKANHKLP